MRQYFSLHVKNLNKKNKMKTWVFTCLIMLQRILEHYIGPHTTCTGKGGWLSLTDIPGLCKSTQERPEPLLPWVICTPRLDQHRTWRWLLTAGSQRYYYTALIILSSYSALSNFWNSPRITVERKWFPWLVSRKLPKLSQDDTSLNANTQLIVFLHYLPFTFPKSIC